MQLITLTDLSFLANPTQLTVPIELKQEGFQLIMKQTLLKLPTEPLLLANPKWISGLWKLVCYFQRYLNGNLLHS